MGERLKPLGLNPRSPERTREFESRCFRQVRSECLGPSSLAADVGQRRQPRRHVLAPDIPQAAEAGCDPLQKENPRDCGGNLASDEDLIGGSQARAADMKHVTYSPSLGNAVRRDLQEKCNAN